MTNICFYILIPFFFLTSCNHDNISEEINENEKNEEVKWNRTEFDKSFLLSNKVLIDTFTTSVVLPDDITWIEDPMINEKTFHHHRTVSNIFEEGIDITDLDSPLVDNHQLFGLEKNTIEWKYENKNKLLFRTVVKNTDTISSQIYLVDSIYFDTTKTISSLVILETEEEEINIYGNEGKNFTKFQLKYIDSLKGKYDSIQVEYFDYILSKHCKGIRVGEWKHYTVNFDSVRITKWKMGEMIKNEKIKVDNNI